MEGKAGEKGKGGKKLNQRINTLQQSPKQNPMQSTGV